MPVTVIGAMNGDKPTWTLVAHVGIIGHDRLLVSLAAPHFINGRIKETKTLSINLVDEAMLPETDYAGSVSGAKADKSNLFAYELGEAAVFINSCHGLPKNPMPRSALNTLRKYADYQVY